MITHEEFLKNLEDLVPDFIKQCSNNCKKDFGALCESYIKWCNDKGIEPLIKMQELKAPTGKIFKIKTKYYD